jgi:hypothetical protein
MNDTYKHQKNATQNKKRKNTRKIKSKRFGGEFFSSSTPVSLVYDSQPVDCDVCKQNSYTEIGGALGKGKGRAFVSSFFFGDLGQSLDTTSVIAYFCKNCGLAKIVRDTPDRKVRPGVIPPVVAPAPVPEMAPAPEIATPPAVQDTNRI